MSSQPRRTGFTGGPSKDTLDIFKERYLQPRESTDPNRTPSPERFNKNAPYQPRISKDVYGQELADQIREQEIRKRSLDENRKREEQYLLRQSLDNYPYGKEDPLAYNTKRGAGLERLYGSPQKQTGFTPQPNYYPPSSNNYMRGYDQSRNTFERPYNNNPFQTPSTGFESPLKKLLNKPYSIEPQSTNSNTNMFYGSGKITNYDESGGKDRRQQMKEAWVKELNEQRMLVAKRKEEEKRKLMEEEQYWEEKFRAQMVELNRNVAREQEVRAIPPVKREENPPVVAQSLEVQPKRSIEERPPVPYRSLEFKSFNQNELYMYDRNPPRKYVPPMHIKAASFNTPQPERKSNIDEYETSLLPNKVNMLKIEILNGRKMFAQQLRDLSEKLNLTAEQKLEARSVQQRVAMGGYNPFHTDPYDLGDKSGFTLERANRDRLINIRGPHEDRNREYDFRGPAPLKLYDGKTGTIAENGVLLDELQENVNTRFVMEPEPKHGSLSHRSHNPEYPGSNGGGYRGSFDDDDKGMQTVALEELSKEIDRYTTLLSDKHYSPTMFPYMGRRDSDELRQSPQKKKPSETIGDNQPLDGQQSKEGAETSDYFKKIDEMMKDFRKVEN